MEGSNVNLKRITLDDTVEETVNKINENSTDIEENMSRLEANFIPYKDNITLKISKIEKELNDYKATIQQVNINQEPKQKATGYGVISLPPNAAEGQVGVSVKGNTEVDNEGNIKSTVSVVRLKSVGKNLVPKNINVPRYAIIEGRECIQPNYADNFTSIQSEGVFYAISPNVFYKYANIKFKPNTQYTLQLRGQNLGTNTAIRIIHTDGSTVIGSTTPGFALSTLTSTIGKTVLAIVFYHQFWGQNTAIDLDSIMLYEGTIATPYEPYKESVAYITAKNESGNILELRSLPNGVKDEVRVSGGKAELIKRIDDLILDGSLDWTFLTSSEGVKKIRVPIPVNTSLGVANTRATYKETQLIFNTTQAIANLKPGEYFTLTLDGIQYFYTAIDDIDSGWVNPPTKQDMKNFFNANPITLTYQLATPIEKPIQTSGSLVSYPSGTVYVEPFVADAGIYTDKMTVLHQDLPIKQIESLYKVDFQTGLEHPLDISQCIISQDKLSFTHPDLLEGDIVFFEYEYDVESTEGETEVEYYDSRYVVKDDVTGKFYKWNVKVSNGIPTIEVVEV